MSVWTEIDEPVLRWLHDGRPSFLPETRLLELALRRGVEDSDEVPGITTEQQDHALGRLLGYGLIDGRRQEFTGLSVWSRLRITAMGMQVLGEWPDLDRLTSAVGLKLLLNELASQAPESADQTALRRMVGVVGEVGEGVAMSTLSSVAGEAGGGVLGE